MGSFLIGNGGRFVARYNGDVMLIAGRGSSCDGDVFYTIVMGETGLMMIITVGRLIFAYEVCVWTSGLGAMRYFSVRVVFTCNYK